MGEKMMASHWVMGHVSDMPTTTEWHAETAVITPGGVSRSRCRSLGYYRLMQNQKARNPFSRRVSPRAHSGPPASDCQTRVSAVLTEWLLPRQLFVSQLLC